MKKEKLLIGVNIQEEGTNNVVITDMDGNFSIYNVSGPSSVLQFTYIGFVPLKIVVGKQTNMSVKLDPDIKRIRGSSCSGIRSTGRFNSRCSRCERRKRRSGFHCSRNNAQIPGGTSRG
mgnify:CR=1 FL=1